MTVPLVVLAALSVLGGLLDLPWAHHDSIAGFLSPVLTPTSLGVANTTIQWTLAGVDFVAALLGLAAAFSVWKTTSPWPRYESDFLARVWRWDDAYDAAIGRPATALAVIGHDVIEPRILDGAVTGVATLTRRSAGAITKAQTGFVRHYALVVVAGVSVAVVFLAVRSW
jgi:NADH-quinone oxidoreductase subunit L